MAYRRPVDEKFKVSSPFGMRKAPVGEAKPEMHNGIDYATLIGTPFVAVAEGMIAAADWQDTDEKKGFGLRIIQSVVVGSEIIQVFYAHLSKISVKAGERVLSGQELGLTGNSGRSSGPHLHLAFRDHKGTWLDPNLA